MRRKSSRRNSGNKRMLLLLTVLFWSFSGLTCIALLNNGLPGEKTNMGQEVGKQYLAAAFPAVSRSAGMEKREPLSGSEIDESLIIKGSPENVEAVWEDQASQQTATGDVLDSASSGAPLVLIYHTHATESYQPVSTGNFHSVEEEGTVREVGKVLKGALEAKGISVLHDKTLHDSPSYSKSYSRSLDTAQQLLAANPSIRVIIDLHRDAASYTENGKHTFTAEGKTVAQFCLVVGEGNANAEALTRFANRINQKANSMYPGFSRGIIMKEYKYNQYIADNHILLEMGNNQNNIEEVKASAALFAQVLEEILKEM